MLILLLTAGLWAFHCREFFSSPLAFNIIILIFTFEDIAWHMAAGLLMQINSLPTQAAQLDIPNAILEQCRDVA